MKKRVSAFTGSDLQVVLSALEARHLVLTGLSTSGVVLSTTREASDKDGRKYYYNSQTKATQWTKPEDLMSAAEVCT